MGGSRPCGHDTAEVEHDSTRGVVVCTMCGCVLEENIIVSEVQFEEGGHGGSHIVGQMVGDSGFRGLTVGGMMGSGKESRQVTLDNAKSRIKQVGAQLRLNNNNIEVAFNFYKRALAKRLTHGRKHTHVIAACIYITCRIEATSHMLLDLSDIMQVNVYELGRTYLKLSSSLRLNIPAIDPCLYIYRFAHKLDLGEKSHEIEMTAMRIAQRMKRDWMHFGRRPSGLCGAALLVAARLHDTHCAVKDIIGVVKVCEATIRKRLSEFGDTPTSKLTLDEFMSVDLEGEEDPPCFKAARKRVKLDQEDIEKCEGEISQLQEQIEKELESSRNKTRGIWAKYAKLPTDETTTEAVVEDENEITAQFVVEQTVDTLQEIMQNSSELVEKTTVDSLRPTASSLGLTESFGLSSSDNIVDNDRRKKLTAQAAQNDDGGILKFDDIDDDEIDSYILDDREAALKRTYWEQINADWILEMKEKAKRKAEEEAERIEKEAQGEIAPKKKRRVKKRNPIQANSAGEAIEKMLQEKRISNKINYDVLKQLSRPFAMSQPEKKDEVDITPTHTAVIESSPIKRLPSIRNHVKLPSVRITKRTTPVTGSKCMENESSTITPVLKNDNEVSGQQTDACEDEGDYEEEYEEEVENAQGEEQLSISQLMSQRMSSSFGENDIEGDFDGDY